MKLFYTVEIVEVDHAEGEAYAIIRNERGCVQNCECGFDLRNQVVIGAAGIGAAILSDAMDRLYKEGK